MVKALLSIGSGNSLRSGPLPFELLLSGLFDFLRIILRQIPDAVYFRGWKPAAIRRQIGAHQKYNVAAHPGTNQQNTKPNVLRQDLILNNQLIAFISIAVKADKNPYAISRFPRTYFIKLHMEMIDDYDTAWGYFTPVFKHCGFTR